MRRALAVIVACGLAATLVGEAQQRPSSRGLILETVSKGSAPNLAGLKAGDELVSWTRSGTAKGDFRTPFDAREFEIEQLPRGGTSVRAVRNGDVVEFTLTAGFWGVTVRPAFADIDLAVYEAGRAQLEKRPTDALTIWQPLVERLSIAGDHGNAAWLITRVASTLVAADQRDVEVQSADQLFDRAAALLIDPANAGLEAMVWEAKGLSYQPETLVPRAISTSVQKPPRLAVAFETQMRAQSLRMATGRGVRTLAVVESEVNVLRAVAFAPKYFLSTSRDSRPPKLEQAELFANQMIDTVTKLGPRSFAHAKAVYRMGNFVTSSQGPYGSNAFTTQEQAEVARRPYLQQAWAILDAVAPTNRLLSTVLKNLLMSPQEAGPGSLLTTDLPQYEAVQRRRMRFGEETDERALLEESAMGLARAMVRRGAITEALAVRDELVRSGSSYSSLAVHLGSLASELNSRGHRAVANSVLEEVLEHTSPPDVDTGLLLASYYRQSGNRSEVGRTLTSLLSRPDSVRLNSADRMRILDALVRSAMATGDAVAAEAWAEQALAEAKTGKDTDLAVRYDLLSDVARWRGNHDKAREYLELAIEQSRLLKSPTGVQQNQQRNRLTRAFPASPEVEAFFVGRLEDARKTGPGTMEVAWALNGVANLVQRERGDFAGEERSRLEALNLTRRLKPGSEDLVMLLNRLGELATRRGDPKTALAYYEEVLTLREDQRLRSSDGAAGGSAEGVGTPVEPYINVVGALVAIGNFAAAFDVAERSRSRSLVQLLRARAVRDTTALPPTLDDERRRVEAEYDEMQRHLAGLSTVKDAVAVAQGIEQRNGLWQRLKDFDRRVAALDPTASALARTAPASLADVRARLDRGTTLLAYLTGPSTTYLFVVTPVADTEPGASGIVAYQLPVGSLELRRSIDAFRVLVRWDADQDASGRGPLMDRARMLFDTLVRPAQRQIASAERLLLSPDGPLQALPFSALVRDEKGRSQFLIQWKSLHTIPSMSVYLETLDRRRPASTTGRVAAFGDPVYAAPQSTAAVDAEVESLLRAGGTLAPLPGTRREVSAIADLFGARATTYLGASSTETRAKALDQSFQFIHFAVHGLLDDRLPMNSALVFSTPVSPSAGEDNGALQAWEIFRHVRIDADLVTLSACESGLGKEVVGEGLIGLTRAFLYAGARTVAASLWKVEDGPTAELMTRFYANLRDGQPKDQALRNAQLALIRLGKPPGGRVDYSSPAHWAAFTLTGDWK